MGWWNRSKQGNAAVSPKSEVAAAVAEGESATAVLADGQSAAANPPSTATGKQARRTSYTGPLLQVKQVERTFQVGGQPLHVLKGINMEVNPGQLVMLRGRSGSGKTTLLNMLGGLDQPTKGEIWFQGAKYHSLSDDKRTLIRRKEMGFIFQAYALMPMLSAWENVELSLRLAEVPRNEWSRRVTDCLELVGLGKRMHHRPFELSGGEQQRVAIAKSIAHRPHLLLADEPTANLDSQMSAQIMAVFQNIIRNEQVSICMTTHDPTILEVADRVYEMVDGKFITNES